MNYINYLLKSIKITALSSLILFYSNVLYSQNNYTPRKARLLIYDFIITDNYKNIKDNKKKIQFYSFVIPETISKSLDNTGNYEIIREKGPFSIGVDFKDKDQNIAYLKKLGELGSQYRSDYIITGSFNVINNQISIRITIFNVKGQDIETVEYEGDEPGVRLWETTDQLAERIKEKIDNFNIIKQEKPAETPSIAKYPSSGIITLGLDSGYLYFSGSFKTLYNNSLYLTPFIDFDLTDNFSISFKYTSIQSDSDGKNVIPYQQIRILSSSMSICYIYRPTADSGISVSAGGGFSRTTVTIKPGQQPFTTPSYEKVSKDPNIDISSFFSYNLSATTFRTGVIYKRIFFKNKPIDTGIIFAGAGLHF